MQGEETVQRVAVKAVIVRDGKVLILRKALYEGNGGREGKWNNPGGRIEPGEEWQTALRREILEETGITDVEIGDPIFIGEWRPTISGVPTQIICTFLLCYTDQKNVKLNYEHEDYRWIKPNEVDNFQMLEPEAEVIKKAAMAISEG